VVIGRILGKIKVSGTFGVMKLLLKSIDAITANFLRPTGPCRLASAHMCGSSRLLYQSHPCSSRSCSLGQDSYWSGPRCVAAAMCCGSVNSNTKISCILLPGFFHIIRFNLGYSYRSPASVTRVPYAASSSCQSFESSFVPSNWLRLVSGPNKVS
jgi:hypothetical protein